MEKNNPQSTSMFFVDLTGRHQLGVPQYEAKDVKSNMFPIVTDFSWDFAVAPDGLRFYIFSRMIVGDPVSLWIYDLGPNGESFPYDIISSAKSSAVSLGDVIVHRPHQTPTIDLGIEPFANPITEWAVTCPFCISVVTRMMCWLDRNICALHKVQDSVAEHQ